MTNSYIIEISQKRILCWSMRAAALQTCPSPFCTAHITVHARAGVASNASLKK